MPEFVAPNPSARNPSHMKRAGPVHELARLSLSHRNPPATLQQGHGAKWAVLPAITNRCQISWNPNRPGHSWAAVPYKMAPAV